MAGPYRLGRLVRHDPRSRAYPAPTAPVLRTVFLAHDGDAVTLTP